MTADLRTTRQARLAEVGDEGQARLASARVTIQTSPSLRESVLDRYLRGAGVQTVLSPGVPEDEAAPWLTALSPAARDVAAGAHAALAVVRAVLRGAPHPRLREPEPRA